jgi:23S rRNA (cytosine1962-C5)-methyltransferase
MLDYDLIDFGHGRKLERFGSVVVDRPEVLATAVPRLSANQWESQRHGRFIEDKNAKGNWELKPAFPENWPCGYSGDPSWIITCKRGPYKHIGVFPEQAAHWAFLQKQLSSGQKYLNLFAYTGAASLTAAGTGADVYHVEASKSVVNWAAQNARSSAMENIRWVCDDAIKFSEREIKRGHKYHGISMDPPVYGRAKKGIHWRLEDKLDDLVTAAADLLVPGGFVVLNTYSPVISLDDMVNICKKRGLVHNEGGWLSVSTKDGRTLLLSKYVVGRLKKPQHFR